MKKDNKKAPIERHMTAAWADTKRKKKSSMVGVPYEHGVEDAKEYVDSNEK